MTGIAGMDFGFPVVAHPRRAGTAYLYPLVRTAPDASRGPLPHLAHHRRR